MPNTSGKCRCCDAGGAIRQESTVHVLEVLRNLPGIQLDVDAKQLTVQRISNSNSVVDADSECDDDNDDDDHGDHRNSDDSSSDDSNDNEEKEAGVEYDVNVESRRKALGAVLLDASVTGLLRHEKQSQRKAAGIVNQADSDDVDNTPDPTAIPIVEVNEVDSVPKDPEDAQVVQQAATDERRDIVAFCVRKVKEFLADLDITRDGQRNRPNMHWLQM